MKRIITAKSLLALVVLFFVVMLFWGIWLASAAAQEKQIIVHVSWDRNTEADMHHYLLQRAVTDTSAWSEMYVAHPAQIVARVAYDDTLHVSFSGKQLFYRVAALDTSDNQSDWSNMVSITVADIIPPAVPTGLDLEITIKIKMGQ